MTTVRTDAPISYPFGASKMKNWVCVCVNCGGRGAADLCISEYPFYFIPGDWSLDQSTGAVRCQYCTKNHETDSVYEPDANLKYFHEHEVRLQFNRGGLSIPQMIIKRRPAQPLPLFDEVFPKKEGPMTTADDTKIGGITPPKKSKVRKHAENAGGAVGLGLTLAGVNEGGEIMLDIAHELSADIPMLQGLLETPQGREMAKFLVAAGIQAGCIYGGDFIPKAEFVGKIAGRQMTASTFLVAGPVMNKLRKHFQKLAGIGEKLIEAEESVEERPKKPRKLAAVEESEAEVEELETQRARSTR